MSHPPPRGGAPPAARASIQPLSKSRFAAGLQCPKRLYLECYERDRRDPLEPGRRALLESARHVGLVARSRFPGGICLSAEHGDDAVRATRRALADRAVPAIYEAAFVHDDVRIRVDVLARAGGEDWDLVEVKSSKQVKDDYVADVAIQLYVAEGAGVRVRRACVLHLSRDYVWPGGAYDPERLFSLHEMTAEARRRMPEIATQVDAMREVLRGAAPPSIPVGPQCGRPHRCPFYGGCHADQPEHAIDTLPRLSPMLRSALAERGIADIREIPADFDALSGLQRRVRDCVLSGRAFRDDEVARVLGGLRYPIHFLDFESCSPALPVIPGMRPFQQTPFQFCDLVLHADGSEEAREYLHPCRTDPRRPLAAALIESLAGAGTVVVYSGFEERTIRSLAEAMPDLAAPLLDHVERRFVDLQRLIHAHYYHPELKGSFSIKDVLPVVVPGLSYDGLAIQDGSQAALAFAEVTDPARPLEARELLREQLREYCRRDTEAMLRMFQALKGAL